MSAIVGENERGDNKCGEPSKILKESPRFNNRTMEIFYFSPPELEKVVTHCRKKETFRVSPFVPRNNARSLPSHLLGSIVMKPTRGWSFIDIQLSALLKEKLICKIVRNIFLVSFMSSFIIFFLSLSLGDNYFSLNAVPKYPRGRFMSSLPPPPLPR